MEAWNLPGGNRHGNLKETEDCGQEQRRVFEADAMCTNRRKNEHVSIYERELSAASGSGQRACKRD